VPGTAVSVWRFRRIWRFRQHLNRAAAHASTAGGTCVLCTCFAFSARHCRKHSAPVVQLDMLPLSLDKAADALLLYMCMHCIVHVQGCASNKLQQCQ
jgi:hypothetical protein